MVIFIHRADYQNISDNPEDVGKTQIIIAKHRNGEIADIPMTFRHSEVRFVDNEESLVNYASAMDSMQPPAEYTPVSSLLDQQGNDFGINTDFPTGSL